MALPVSHQQSLACYVGDDGARLDKVECCDGRIHLVETFAATQKLGVDCANLVEASPGVCDSWPETRRLAGRLRSAHSRGVGVRLFERPWTSIAWVRARVRRRNGSPHAHSACRSP
jgi:hypothetical protein